MNTTGYVVYFSDRRGNKNAANVETGEFGYEDIVNPASPPASTNGGLPDVGEDFNGNGVLDVYGDTPRLAGAPHRSTHRHRPDAGATPTSRGSTRRRSSAAR